MTAGHLVAMGTGALGTQALGTRSLRHSGAGHSVAAPSCNQSLFNICEACICKTISSLFPCHPATNPCLIFVRHVSAKLAPVCWITISTFLHFVSQHHHLALSIFGTMATGCRNYCSSICQIWEGDGGGGLTLIYLSLSDFQIKYLQCLGSWLANFGGFSGKNFTVLMLRSRDISLTKSTL